jgi:multidrug efflux pump subunit AcrA (membrane-fusion protein)
VSLELQGQVMPATKVVLMPEVGGRVVWQSPELVPGGTLKKGAPLVRIDARDYALMLEQQQAQLSNQQLMLKVEHGRRKVAEREWELFQKDRERAGIPLPSATGSAGAEAPDAGTGDDEGPLVLREPHVKSAQVAVKAAQNNLERAQLQLSKTTLTAPFNALVLAESVDTGQLVSPGYQLATLVGTDAFWVQVSIPMDRLPYVRVPRGDDPGSPARIWFEIGNGRIERQGHVIRLLGDLDPVGRLARILVEVRDPFLLEDEPGGPAAEPDEGEGATPKSKLPLLLGSFVGVEIQGVELGDVAEIPRRGLQANDQVFVVDADDTLRIEKVDVGWGTADTVVVSGNLADGDRIVTSALQVPVPGMKLSVVAAARSPKASAEADKPRQNEATP